LKTVILVALSLVVGLLMVGCGKSVAPAAPATATQSPSAAANPFGGLSDEEYEKVMKMNHEMLKDAPDSWMKIKAPTFGNPKKVYNFKRPNDAPPSPAPSTN